MKDTSINRDSDKDGPRDGATWKLDISEDERRGRGAVTNATGRFEKATKELVDDGWHPDDPIPLRTTVTMDSTRTIIARNQSPDISFDRSINPYRGCEHGCIYCFARPTHAYLGLSPGLDFESRLFAKPKAAELLDKELRRPRYHPRVIAMGTNTDPYQPIEKKMKITSQVLHVLERFGHPVSIVTKSDLVLQDTDILQKLAQRNLTKVAISVTTLDRRIARKMEPRASTPAKRLEAIRQLSDAGIPTAVMVAPVVPVINDHEIEAILEKARDAGAAEAGYVLLRMPLEIKDLFREWLQEEFPDRAAHVISVMRDMRGGADYDSQWHKRMSGDGPYAQLVSKRFHLARRKLGFQEMSHKLALHHFKPPPIDSPQLTLF